MEKSIEKNNVVVTPEDERFMQMAIDLSVENVANGGGPFGAVIVRDGEVLAAGANRVTANNDPTAHAEVSAIRTACAKVGNFKLEGATIYTSCEPCPMCLSAIYWAGISRIFYGNTKADAKAIEGAKEEKFAGVKFADNTPDAHLVGAIVATTETGKVAQVKGTNAVYVFVVNKINGEVDPASYATERIPLTEKATSDAYKESIYNSFLKKAEIKDHRTDMTF